MCGLGNEGRLKGIGEQAWWPPPVLGVRLREWNLDLVY